ncbi:hypothetical protein ABZX12_39115 [Kribbella sp. NPDC003505]|uniref:hypothetical protein n=1 Tax=Kribbella sp. NPDC003505 TaxID=3154448 RepID=UPI0033B4AE6A
MPGRAVDGNPTCRGCSGVKLNLDCRRCGAEEELYRAGHCWRCVLSQEIDSVLTGPDGVISDQLKPVAAALRAMQRANSGLTWIRQSHVRQALQRLASCADGLDHDAFDELPASRTREYIRGLLIEYGALPRRDRHIDDYAEWLRRKLAAIEDVEDRRIIERFGRWHNLRRLRRHAQRDNPTHGAFLRAKQSTTVAIDFVEWLRVRGLALGHVRQSDVDAWYAGGPTTRGLVETLLYWAMNQRLVHGIAVPRRADDDAAATLGDPQRMNAIRRILTDDRLALNIRISAGMVLLFGQPVHRLVAMRIEDTDTTGTVVRVRLGDDALEVPEPFGDLLRAHLAARPNLQTAAHRDCPWVFPGFRPGQHLSPQHVRAALREIGAPALASRTATWRQLVKDAPPAVLAEALGVSPATAMRHATLAGADFLAYAATRTANRE